MLRIGLVVASHPESNAVDLVMMNNGQRLSGVQVMSPMAGTDFGLSDLPAPEQSGADIYDATMAGKRDILAVVSMAGMTPIALGFLYPQVAQCLFADKDRRINRHASDVYSTIDKDGNTEFFHPSGTFLRIGTTAAHEDLTGKDYDKKWKIGKNADKAVHVHLEVANAGSKVASVSIDPDGNVTIQNNGNLQVNSSGNINMQSGGDINVSASGNIKMTGSRIDLN